jgi:hypothetical protein
MKTIVTWTLITLFGSVGWWLGSFLGIYIALFLSLIGSGVGMYCGSWLARNYG